MYRNYAVFMITLLFVSSAVALDVMVDKGVDGVFQGSDIQISPGDKITWNFNLTGQSMVRLPGDLNTQPDCGLFDAYHPDGPNELSAPCRLAPPVFSHWVPTKIVFECYHQLI